MKEYFFLTEKIKNRNAFAYTQGTTPLAHELIPLIRDLSEIPFEMELKKVSNSNTDLQVSSDLSDLSHLWLDFQPNNLAWPIMSEKMMKLICDNLTGKESIVWMCVKIKSDVEIKKYFVPRFENKMDVLDENKTVFVGKNNHIVKPVFSLKKIEHYNLFHIPDLFWEITSSIFVSNQLKKALQREKITGINFENIAVS
jgi:hypothetical protein